MAYIGFHRDIHHFDFVRVFVVGNIVLIDVDAFVVNAVVIAVVVVVVGALVIDHDD